MVHAHKIEPALGPDSGRAEAKNEPEPIGAVGFCCDALSIDPPYYRREVSKRRWGMADDLAFTNKPPVRSPVRNQDSG